MKEFVDVVTAVFGQSKQEFQGAAALNVQKFCEGARKWGNFERVHNFWQDNTSVDGDDGVRMHLSDTT